MGESGTLHVVLENQGRTIVWEGDIPCEGRYPDVIVRDRTCYCIPSDWNWADHPIYREVRSYFVPTAADAQTVQDRGKPRPVRLKR